MGNSAGRLCKYDSVVPYVPKRENKGLTEIAKLQREFNIEYHEAVKLLEENRVAEYRRKRFLEEAKRNADNVIVEKSWIGQTHGRATNKNAKWKKAQ